MPVLVAFGESREGFLGESNGRLELDFPYAVHSLSAGKYHLALITESRKLYTWGWGVLGVLGHDDEESQKYPRLVANVDRVEQVSCGAFHTAAINSDGVIFSWGSGVYGRLGHGSEISLKSPRPIQAFRGIKVVCVSLGDYHSAAVAGKGDVYCWGAGDRGQIGNGLMQHQSLPIKLSFGNRRATQLSCGSTHTCAVMATGELFAWGSNTKGQLGFTSDAVQSRPAQVKTLGPEKAFRVACGGQHSIVRAESGTVYSFGCGEDGQLGIGHLQESAEPVQVTGIMGSVEDFSCGEAHTVVRASGHANIWGRGNLGQLGTKAAYVAHPVTLEFGDKQVTAAACGVNFTVLSLANPQSERDSLSVTQTATADRESLPNGSREHVSTRKEHRRKPSPESAADVPFPTRPSTSPANPSTSPKLEASKQDIQRFLTRDFYDQFQQLVEQSSHAHEQVRKLGEIEGLERDNRRFKDMIGDLVRSLPGTSQEDSADLVGWGEQMENVIQSTFSEKKECAELATDFASMCFNFWIGTLKRIQPKEVAVMPVTGPEDREAQTLQAALDYQQDLLGRIHDQDQMIQDAIDQQDLIVRLQHQVIQERRKASEVALKVSELERGKATLSAQLELERAFREQNNAQQRNSASPKPTTPSSSAAVNLARQRSPNASIAHECEECETYKDCVDAAKYVIDTLEVQNSTLLQEIESLRSEVESDHPDGGEMKEDLTKQKAIDQLQKAVDMLQQDNERLRDLLEEGDKERTRLSVECERVAEEKEKEVTQILHLRQRERERTESNATDGGEVSVSPLRQKMAESERSDLFNSVRSLKADVKKAEEDRDRALEHVNELKKQMAKAEKRSAYEIEEMRKRCDLVQSEFGQKMLELDAEKRTNAALKSTSESRFESVSAATSAVGSIIYLLKDSKKISPDEVVPGEHFPDDESADDYNLFTNIRELAGDVDLFRKRYQDVKDALKEAKEHLKIETSKANRAEKELLASKTLIKSFGEEKKKVATTVSELLSEEKRRRSVLETENARLSRSLSQLNSHSLSVLNEEPRPSQ